MKVLNFSTGFVERAKQKECPRCKGRGATIHDDDKCFMCKGRGKVWMSHSGWYRPLYTKLVNSELW